MTLFMDSCAPALLKHSRGRESSFTITLIWIRNGGMNSSHSVTFFSKSKSGYFSQFHTSFIAVLLLFYASGVLAFN